MQTTALLFPILQNWQNRLGWSLGTHKQRVPSPEKPRGGCPGLSGSAVLPGRWHHGKSHHDHYPLSHTRGSQQGHSWPGAHSSLRLALPCPCRADGQTEVWGKGCAGMCMNVTGGLGGGEGLGKAQQVCTQLQPGAEGLHSSSGRDPVHTAPGQQWDANLCPPSPWCPLTCAAVPQ